MDINVRLTASDLQEKGVFDALEALCLCFGGEKYLKIKPPAEKNSAQHTQNQPTIAAVSAPAPTVSAPATMAAPAPAPVAAPAPTYAVPPAMPVTAPAPAPTVPPVPVAAPTAAAVNFTVPQVAQAAAVFAETSDTAREQVVNLIHSFGARALNEIPQDKLGEFATGLRGLGARI